MNSPTRWIHPLGRFTHSVNSPRCVKVCVIKMNAFLRYGTKFLKNEVRSWFLGFWMFFSRNWTFFCVPGVPRSILLSILPVYSSDCLLTVYLKTVGECALLLQSGVSVCPGALVYSAGMDRETRNGECSSLGFSIKGPKIPSSFSLTIIDLVSFGDKWFSPLLRSDLSDRIIRRIKPSFYSGAPPSYKLFII